MRAAVTWNGSGRPFGASAIASPSNTAAVTGSARTASTTSGTRAVMSSSVRVNTATSAPWRWIWIRAPSSFHSIAAVPSRSSAAVTLSAVWASIGCSGRPTSSR